MEYKVSEKIQKKFDTLTKDAKVQKALQFMENDQNEIINRQNVPRSFKEEGQQVLKLIDNEDGTYDLIVKKLEE